MSDTYNPETKDYERLEALEIEARKIAQKRDQAATPEDRKVLERQLEEVEGQINTLKKRLKP